VSDQHYRDLSRKFRCDCGTIMLCLMIWSLIALSILSFIFFSKAKANANGWVDGNAVALAFITSISFSTIAGTFNETLMDRCWKRVRTQALRGRVRGSHLRAANFDLSNTAKRLLLFRITKREIAMFMSYALLRWGTLVSFSVIQLTVDYRRNPDNTDLFLTQIRLQWVAVPLGVHIASIVLGLAVIGLPPWCLFFARYDDRVVHAAYGRYLALVPYGSAATSDKVATLLDKTSCQPRDFTSLAIAHRPGLQLAKKLRGVLSGFIVVIAASMVLYAFQHHGDQEGIPGARFLYNAGLTATSVGYTFAQSFAIWTLDLESITAADTEPSHLGSTSGIMLLIKAFRQHRPAKVVLFYWIFWVHGIVVRLAIYLLIWALSINNIVPEQQTINAALWSINSHTGWLFWPGIVWAAVLVPFVLWFVLPFAAPLACFDGWRQAKILEGAIKSGKGRYGIQGDPGRGRAVFGANSRPFEKEILL
jgi:hypothetical protein